MRTTSEPIDEGPIRFARYAAPPNRLGYCGPSGSDHFDELIAADAVAELRHEAREFQAAFPYLALLAGEQRECDPLSSEVVEAYWLGNSLLNRVATSRFGRSIDDRFRRRAGSSWQHLERSVVGGLANHAFHVLVASPWIGLMRDGVVDEPLGIVDACRISWGRVISQSGEDLLVHRTPLVWTNGRLAWGPTRVDHIAGSFPAAPGAVVSIHWNRACEVLRPDQLEWLIAVTVSQMTVADQCGRPCG